MSTEPEYGRQAETSILRVIVVVLGIASFVFLGLTVGSLVQQAPFLDPVWLWVSVGFVFGAPLALVPLRRRVSVRTLKRMLGGYAIGFTIIVATFPLAMTTPSLPDLESPWTLSITALGTSAAALAWRPLPAWLLLAANIVVMGVVRYVASGGGALTTALQDSFFTLVFSAVFTGLCIIGLTNARALDSTERAARDAAAQAAATAARVAEQARLDGLVHDEVISTLYYASLGRPELADSVTRQARRAVEHLARLREPDDSPTTEVSLDDLSERVMTAVRGVDRNVVPELHVASADTIPREVAAAIAEATSEALRNSIEHGGGAGVTRTVRMSATGQSVSVRVQDDGDGFDPARVPGDRLGIVVSIRGRLAAVRGTATVRSAPGEGAEIHLHWERP